MKKTQALKPLQLNAIQLLAVGTPAYQVAERLEVSTMTIYRWQRQPEFEAKLNTITHSGLEEIAKKMNIAALTATEVLQEIMNDMSLPQTTQIKAALGVLRAMPAVNGALEKSFQHRDADFDLRTRWSGPAFTYDRNGNPCRLPVVRSGDMPSGEVVV